MRRGDEKAVDRLYQRVYEELRRLAHAQLSRHVAGHLDTTALVSEAYVRLMGGAQPPWANRKYFFKGTSGSVCHPL